MEGLRRASIECSCSTTMHLTAAATAARIAGEGSERRDSSNFTTGSGAISAQWPKHSATTPRTSSSPSTLLTSTASTSSRCAADRVVGSAPGAARLVKASFRAASSRNCTLGWRACWEAACRRGERYWGRALVVSPPSATLAAPLSSSLLPSSCSVLRMMLCRLEYELRSVERPISPSVRSANRCAASSLASPSVLSRVVTVEVTCLSPAATHSAAMHCATDSWAAFPVLGSLPASSRKVSSCL
mmetsp:Transcript_7417/g.21915  ORF Transcript_7417/g.21915 Transcript_7417/m.21915 type:complete len:244 (+) Transcript_7417:2611-3342(+)